MNAGIYFNKNFLSENRPYVERLKAKLSVFEKVIIVGNYDDLAGLDVLFVLGGDGTILTVASECAKKSVKIIGINYGHLGFLTEFEQEKLDEAAQLVCSGNYSITERKLLEIKCGDNTYTALNDLVIQRSTSGVNFSNTVDLRAEIDGCHVDSFISDGIIVSTPTGSTAYSLSAGGSVLTPDINAFIMTPICAHSLHSRPVVYSDNSVLKISHTGKTPLNIIVDGIIKETVNSPSEFQVKKSNYVAEFITRGKDDFFKKLLIKLNIWSR